MGRGSGGLQPSGGGPDQTPTGRQVGSTAHQLTTITTRAIIADASMITPSRLDHSSRSSLHRHGLAAAIGSCSPTAPPRTPRARPRAPKLHATRSGTACAKPTAASATASSDQPQRITVDPKPENADQISRSGPDTTRRPAQHARPPTDQPLGPASRDRDRRRLLGNRPRPPNRQRHRGAGTKHLSDHSPARDERARLPVSLERLELA